MSTTVFLTFLIRETSLDQLGTYSFAKLFLYFDILTLAPVLNLGSSFLISFLVSLCVVDFKPTGFFLVVLSYVLFYLRTLSSTHFFDIEVM